MGSKAYCNFPNSSLIGKNQVFSICLYAYFSGYMQIGLKALTLVRAITLRSVVPLAMFPNLPSIAAQGVERSHWLRLFTFFLLFFFFFSTFSALLWIDSSLLKIRGYFVFLSQKIGSGILTQSFSSYFATMLGNRRLVIWFKKIERTMDVSSQSGKRNCFSFINK